MYYSVECRKCGLHFHPKPGEPHDCNREVKLPTFEVEPVVMVVVCRSCHHYSKVVGEDIVGRRMLRPSLFEFIGLPTTKGLRCSCGRGNWVMLNREKY